MLLQFAHVEVIRPMAEDSNPAPEAPRQARPTLMIRCTRSPWTAVLLATSAMVALLSSSRGVAEIVRFLVFAAVMFSMWVAIAKAFRPVGIWPLLGLVTFIAAVCAATVRVGGWIFTRMGELIVLTFLCGVFLMMQQHLLRRLHQPPRRIEQKT